MGNFQDITQLVLCLITLSKIHLTNANLAPYLLSVQDTKTKSQLCNAALVNVEGVQIALAPAHCLSQVSGDNVTLLAYKSDRSLEQSRYTDKIAVNSGSENNYLDIAILFFKKPFQLTANVKPVPLAPPTPTSGVKGNIAVYGWNLLQVGNLNQIQVAGFPLISNEDCTNAIQQLHEDFSVEENGFCAGRAASSGIRFCEMDIGLPAVNDAGYLTGIFTYGVDCEEGRFPGLFINVPYYTEWITATVKEYKNSQ